MRISKAAIKKHPASQYFLRSMISSEEESNVNYELQILAERAYELPFDGTYAKVSEAGPYTFDPVGDQARFDAILDETLIGDQIVEPRLTVGLFPTLIYNYGHDGDAWLIINARSGHFDPVTGEYKPLRSIFARVED